MLTLYDYPDCPFCQKVRVVLAEKDLEYEKVFVDLRKQEQKSPDFLRLNPYGKVPVLIDEDEVMYESTVINEYLEDEYPIPRLMPEDSGGRARVRLLEDYCDNSFIPATTTLLAQLRKAEAERDTQRVDQAREDLRRGLYFLSDRLGGQEYLVGKEFTLADAAFAPRIMVIGRLGVELEPALSNVQAWIERIRARPSVRALGLYQHRAQACCEPVRGLGVAGVVGSGGPRRGCVVGSRVSSALPDIIPLFPLPNAVLFPRMPLPLHVFEPRYRAMVRDAARGARLIGMALLCGDWERDYYGRPPVFPTGTVGEMVHVEELADGRFNIVLRGLREYTIVRELEGAPYREAAVTWRPPVRGPLPAEMRTAIAREMHRYLTRLGRASAPEEMLKGSVDDETFVNFLAQHLDVPPLEKQALLEAPTLEERAGRLLDALVFRLEELRTGIAGPPRAH